MSVFSQKDLWLFYKRNCGFTLIELLVVISIISLLSSVMFASVNSTRDKARYAKVKAEVQQFVVMATVAQGESNKRLQDITGSGCSDCVCRGRDIRNVAATDSCYLQWVNALTTIQTATNGTVSGLDKMTRDPWGSPYMLDENEREGSPSDCRFDTLRSVGPNGLWEGPSDQDCPTGDDVCMKVPHSRQCP